MRKIKITAAQIIAMREATMREDGSYELTTAKGQTITALIRAGVVVDGTRSLTRQGVSVMHSVCDVSVIASKGYSVSVSDDQASMELFTLDAPETAVTEPVVSTIMSNADVQAYDKWCADQDGSVTPVSESVGDEPNDVPNVSETNAESVVGSDAWLAARTCETSNECTCSKGAPSPGMRPCLHCGGDNSWCAKHYPAPQVEIVGPEGFDMIPEMSELTGDCYFACGRPVTGMFCDYVGRTEGVCDLDRSQLGDHITVTPVDPSVWGGASDNVDVVCVIQNRPGNSGVNHYHAPGCRDIAREMKRYGQKQSDVMEAAFSDVAEILVFEYADVASDSADSNTPEWWSAILDNATGDIYGGVKIMPCLDIPAGRAGNGPLVTKDGFYRVGFDQPTPERVAEIRAEIDAHTCNEAECITCMVRDMNREEIPSTEEFPNERAYKSGTENARDYARDNGFTEYGEEWQTVFRSSYALSMEIQAEENANDAGFMETLVTKEYELSVIVDDVTGTRVSLGWVTLTMNAAQCMDFDRVAEEYGRTQNTRTPRHGWASIITVHDVADI